MASGVDIIARGLAAKALSETGGTVYTAGTGIEISNFEISVDEDVVATQDDLQNIREVAEGKCKAFVLSYQKALPTTDAEAQLLKKVNGDSFTSLTEFNTYVTDLTYYNPNFVYSYNSIGLTATSYIITDENIVIKSEDMNDVFQVGDIIYVTELDVPDRWLSTSGGLWVCNKLETSKVDLTNKADKVTNATANDIAGLDTNGNLTDSGIAINNVVTKSGIEDITGDKNFYGSKIKISSDYSQSFALYQNGMDGTLRLVRYNKGTEEQWIHVDSSTGAIIPGAGVVGKANLGVPASKWKDLYLSGAIHLAGNITDETNSVSAAQIVKGLYGGYATNQSSILYYETINNISIDANRTFTLQAGPANTYPEYRANITNTGAADIVLTFPSGTVIKTNDEDITIVSNVLTLPAGTTIEVNIQNGKMIAFNWSAN